MLLRGTETVLLVEDDEAVRNLIQRVLDQYGYRVLPAARGEEALSISRSRKEEIHLLLTDVVLPGMSGGELAQRVTALMPNLKVLYMSGYTNEVLSHHGVLKSGLEFIEKPFTPEALARKVREVLDK